MKKSKIAPTYIAHQPNGLDLVSFHSNGHAYEHEHGDHPTYIRPVDIKFVGEINQDQREDACIVLCEENLTDDQIRDYLSETHALIYTDGNIAITLYECNYVMWSLRTGDPLENRFVSKGSHKIIA